MTQDASSRGSKTTTQDVRSPMFHALWWSGNFFSSGECFSQWAIISESELVLVNQPPAHSRADYRRLFILKTFDDHLMLRFYTCTKHLTAKQEWVVYSDVKRMTVQRFWWLYSWASSSCINVVEHLSGCWKKSDSYKAGRVLVTGYRMLLEVSRQVITLSHIDWSVLFCRSRISLSHTAESKLTL